MLVRVYIDLVDVSSFKVDFEHHETAIARTFSTIVITALARELAGFAWAIGQEMRNTMGAG